MQTRLKLKKNTKTFVKKVSKTFLSSRNHGRIFKKVNDHICSWNKEIKQL